MFTRKELPDFNSYSIAQIADIIASDWIIESEHPAYQYVEAMKTMHSINDDYYLDSGIHIIAGFLEFSRAWNSPTAFHVKTELKRRVDLYNKELSKKTNK